MHFCASTATILANSPQYYAIPLCTLPILSNYLNSLLSLQILLLLLLLDEGIFRVNALCHVRVTPPIGHDATEGQNYY